VSYRRVLVAVDDSPAGLQAARAAIDLAASQDAAVHAITVLRDHVVERTIGGEASDTQRRVATGARALLAWVAELAESHHVTCDTIARAGDPFRQILDEADAWDADVIVIGRSDRRGPSSPYLGSETAHVLEFTDRPVLVVPRGNEHRQ
jgi:nucleotide-binding universal stress UspA family protein